jgi:hypothetical protein
MGCRETMKRRGENVFFASDGYSESNGNLGLVSLAESKWALTHCKEWPDLVQPDKLGLIRAAWY